MKLLQAGQQPSCRTACCSIARPSRNPIAAYRKPLFIKPLFDDHRALAHFQQRKQALQVRAAAAPSPTSCSPDLAKAISPRLDSFLQQFWIGDEHCEMKRFATKTVLLEIAKNGSATDTSKLGSAIVRAGMPARGYLKQLCKDSRCFFSTSMSPGSVRYFCLQPDFLELLLKAAQDEASAPISAPSSYAAAPTPYPPDKLDTVLQQLWVDDEHRDLKRFVSKQFLESGATQLDSSFLARQIQAAGLASKGFCKKVSKHSECFVLIPPHFVSIQPQFLGKLQKALAAEIDQTEKPVPETTRSSSPSTVAVLPSAALPSTSATGTPPPTSIKTTYIDNCTSEAHSRMLAHLEASWCVAVDCEWAQDKLCLVQIYAPRITRSSSSSSSSDAFSEVVYLVDPLSGQGLMESLGGMLSSRSTLKVFHDLREDVSRLHQACKVHVAPVLDTQIAHRLVHYPHCSIPMEDTGASTHLYKRIGLGALSSLHGFYNPAKKAVVAKMDAESNLSRMWLQRPIPSDLIRYAASDVLHLIKIAERLGALNLDSPAREISQMQADETQGGPFSPPPHKELDLSFGSQLVPIYQERDGGSLLPGFSSSSIPAHSFGSTGQAALDIIDLLPEGLKNAVIAALERKGSDSFSSLSEIMIDEGRPVKLRFRDGRPTVYLPITASVREALQQLASEKEEHKDGGLNAHPPDLPSSLFGSDGRMTIPRSLHRISGMRDRLGNVYALTYRVGRHKPGLAAIFSDMLAEMSSNCGHGVSQGPGQPTSRKAYGTSSILIVGRPGSGKTSLLRDIARILSDDMQQEVVVIDTSAEIAGDSFVPHECIGTARRFLVPHRERQHSVMLEAVQNHGPDALVVDEIANRQEVAAVSTISQRGVGMVATAHGNDLHSLLKNPELVSLCGGVQSVTIGDEAAKLRLGSAGQSKVMLERRGAPVFSALIEVVNQNTWRVHPNLADSVDCLLADNNAGPHTHVRHYEGCSQLITFETIKAARRAPGNFITGGAVPADSQNNASTH